MFNQYQAGFNAYVNGTNLDPAEQTSDWQTGYDHARDDHHKMEAAIMTASAAQDDAHWAGQ